MVATPIGNLADLSFRALEILTSAEIILCEDTRHTLRLLAHYQITGKRLVSYHQHSKILKIQQIIDWLKQGRQLALVSDAGTPGISDPGNYLVQQIRKVLPEVLIVPIAGVSAVAALASVSGLPTDQFLFLGFLPHKKGRQTLLKTINTSEYTIFVYESVHRIKKLLEELVEFCGEDRYIVVGRELTKQFEHIYSGTVSEVSQNVLADALKGEYVVAIAPAGHKH